MWEAYERGTTCNEAGRLRIQSTERGGSGLDSNTCMYNTSSCSCLSGLDVVFRVASIFKIASSNAFGGSR